jgi:hypothetical protein
VNAKSRLITFWETKNGDSRSVPLTTRALAAIERQREEGADGPFVGLRVDTCRSAWDRLRVSYPQFRDATWYTCRHTFASRLVQRGVDLYRVQKLLGHRDAAMTMRYAKFAPKHLAAAVEVLEPARLPVTAPRAWRPPEPPRHTSQNPNGLSLGLSFGAFQGLSAYEVTINRPVVGFTSDRLSNWEVGAGDGI